MANFYLIETLTTAEIGESISMTGPEARHAVTVSRVAAGDPIVVGNGAGFVVTGTVRTADASELTLDVETVVSAPARTPALWLAQALAKGDRDELAVQVAAELGVDGVIPWAAQRSIVKWEGAKIAKGHQRWSAIVREATKQSMRPWLPEVASVVTSNQLATLGESARLVVLDPTSDHPLSTLHPDARDTVVIVGPEGGITQQELERFTASGAERVRLGDTVLRTSTAGPAALALLNVQLQRW